MNACLTHSLGPKPTTCPCTHTFPALARDPAGLLTGALGQAEVHIPAPLCPCHTQLFRLLCLQVKWRHNKWPCRVHNTQPVLNACCSCPQITMATAMPIHSFSQRAVEGPRAWHGCGSWEHAVNQTDQIPASRNYILRKANW